MGSNSQQNLPQIAGALTYPSGSQLAQPMTPQPRQPRNLQGLLRFAMEATKAEDAPGNSELGPMDEERRKFLEEALKSLTVDVAQVLQNAIKMLTDKEKIMAIKSGEPLPQDVMSAFSNLMEFIDDIDIANDFYKMGGFAIFPICYSSDSEEVRANASWVLAELCQNNPFCQARSLECGLLNVLLTLAQTEQGTALAKCLYAISCTCREFEPACKALISSGGCETLLGLLIVPDLQARTKAAFFIRYLCQHHAEAKEIFIQLNLVKTIAEQIKSGRDDTTEHLLGILLVLTEEPESRILAQCRSYRLGLKGILEEGLLNEEQRESSQTLLERIFKDCPPEELENDDDVDR